MVEIATIPFVYSVLIDQSDANSILSSVLDYSDLASGLFSIDVDGLFADDLMEISIILDLLHSQVVYLELRTVEVILTPEVILLEGSKRNDDLGLDRLKGSFATYKTLYVHVHISIFLRRL